MLELTKEIVLGKAEAGGGGQTINNEDLTITANGTYTASEGYTGIGTATVEVPQYEEKTVVNKTGSAVAKDDKVWVDGSDLTSYYDMSNPNFSSVGSPTVTNGVASNFSVSDYIKPKCAFNNAYSSTSTWEWRTKIRITTLDVFNPVWGGEAGTYLPDLFVGTSNRIGMNLSSNGTSYNICELAMGTTYLSTNTDYWVKWGWTGTVYYIDLSTDGVNYTREVSVNSTSPIYSYDYSNKPLMIGFRVGEYFRGGIDLKETKLSINGASFNYTWQGYNVLTTADTNTGVALEAMANNASGKVGIGELGKKYGATINNFLGDVNANGVLQIPTTNTDLVFNGVKDLAQNALCDEFSCIQSTNANKQKIRSVSFPDLVAISGHSGLKGFATYQTNLTSVSFPKLQTISGEYALTQAFRATGVTSVSFPELENITSNNSACENCFGNCQNLTAISFPKLKILKNQSLSSAFGSCNIQTATFPALYDLSGYKPLASCFSYNTALTSVSFPALKSTSFGSYTNQFNNMLSGVTGCTVHFPSNLQSVIGSWADVTNGFGGTNTTVLFDLPATE